MRFLSVFAVLLCLFQENDGMPVGSGPSSPIKQKLVPPTPRKASRREAVAPVPMPLPTVWVDSDVETPPSSPKRQSMVTQGHSKEQELPVMNGPFAFGELPPIAQVNVLEHLDPKTGHALELAEQSMKALALDYGASKESYFGSVGKPIHNQTDCSKKPFGKWQLIKIAHVTLDVFKACEFTPTAMPLLESLTVYASEGWIVNVVEESWINKLTQLHQLHKVSVLDNNYVQLLWFAIVANNAELKSFLIPRTDVNYGKNSAYSFLRRAIELNQVDLVQSLLQRGADVNVAYDKGVTPLHLAVSSSEAEILIPLLRQFGASVNAKNKNGKTPLDLAKKWRTPAIAKLLE